VSKLCALGEVCPIVADHGEARSRIPHALAVLGATVEMARLPAGDYDLGRGVLVERKTVFDLHESIHSGRFWPQVGRLRRAAWHPYLLVEGDDIDRGRLGVNAVRGACLAVIEQNICVIRSSRSTDTARWLLLLARRVQRGPLAPRDRPSYAQLLKRRADAVPEALLCAIPGISVVTARVLLRQFGSVAAVCNASEEALLAVPGIGGARLMAIRAAFS
jgi:ERCC4-type nuclease